MMKRLLIAFGLSAALLTTQAPTHSAHANDTQMLGTIIGAVGGGLIGSTVGKGDGRIVATAAGTVIGAVLGHEITSNQYEYEEDGRYKRTSRYEEPKKVIVYRDRPAPAPRHVKWDDPDKKKKKWKKAARYGDDVIVCKRNANRCQWYD